MCIESENPMSCFPNGRPRAYILANINSPYLQIHSWFIPKEKSLTELDMSTGHRSLAWHLIDSDWPSGEGKEKAEGIDSFRWRVGNIWPMGHLRSMNSFGLTLPGH